MIRTFSFAVLFGLYALLLVSLAFIPEDGGNVAVNQAPDEIALAN